MSEGYVSTLQPVVSGVRPNSGPYETKIDIRGSNLGSNRQDVTSVVICGVECISRAEWVKNTHIRCFNLVVTANDKTGEIVVTTKSGGKGRCDVTFTAKPPSDVTGLESQYWEGETFEVRFGRTKTVTAEPRSSKEEDLLGVYPDLNVTERPSDRALQKIIPGASGDIKKEDFDPVYYLVKNHSRSSLSQLRSGQTYLYSMISKQSQGPLDHLKHNIAHIIECQDIMQSVERDILNDSIDTQDKNLSDRVESRLVQLNAETNRLFGAVLQRKDESDCVRNALNVLTRFNFLFSLPSSIQKHLNNRNYDLIVSDYDRGRVLFEGLEHPLFDEVHSQVEAKVDSARLKLLAELRDLPITLTRQIELTGYLHDLGYAGDAAWICIENMFDNLKHQLHQCRTAYDDIPPSKEENLEEPVKVLFLNDLCELFTEQFKLVWTVGDVYQKSGPASAGINYSGPRFYKERSYPAAFERNQQSNGEQLRTRYKEVIAIFCGYVNQAFMPAGNEGSTWPAYEADSSNGLLMSFLRQLRSVVSSLDQMGVPSGLMKQTIVVDLMGVRVSVVENLLVNCNDELDQKQESWQLNVSDSGMTCESVGVVKIIISGYMTHLLEAFATGPHEMDVREYLKRIMEKSGPYDDKVKQIEADLYDMLTLTVKKYLDYCSPDAPLPFDKLASSNISACSSFSSLDCPKLILLLLNNIRVLKDFVLLELRATDESQFPFAYVWNQAEACYLTIESELLDRYQAVGFTTPPPVAPQLCAGSCDEISRCCRLLLFQLVNVFNTICVICPSLTSQVFRVILSSTCSVINEQSLTSGFQNFTYCDIRLVVRLFHEYLSQDSLAQMQHLLTKFPPQFIQKCESSDSIDVFLKNNHFHFATFLG